MMRTKLSDTKLDGSFHLAYLKHYSKGETCDINYVKNYNYCGNNNYYYWNNLSNLWGKLWDWILHKEVYLENKKCWDIHVGDKTW